MRERTGSSTSGGVSRRSNLLTRAAWRTIVGATGVLLAVGCTSVPAGLRPIEGFDVNRYLGRWYEVARLDHSFERGLTDCSAEYRLSPADGIAVINRGFDPKAGVWREARGIARFNGSSDVASLKVSFFRPFWGGYHVIALDGQNYNWALVAGPTRSYLWVLSRTPTMEPVIWNDIVARAGEWGFDVEALIHVEQRREEGSGAGAESPPISERSSDAKSP